MLECYVQGTVDAVPIIALSEAELDAWLSSQPERVQRWVRDTGFKAANASHCLLPSEQGGLQGVLLGMGGAQDFWAVGALASKLPAGDYRLHGFSDLAQRSHACMAWGLGAYRFERYKRDEGARARLVLDVPEAVQDIVSSIYSVRDLVNTPAADMMPQDLGAAAQALAQRYGGSCQEIVGKDLLTQNYPAIHAVGRASDHAPRLIDLRWGEQDHPRLTLVGKGVCFDTGGLDLKPARAMRHMKKDMGGAAHVLGLAQMIISQNLPVRLRVLIGAADNAVSGDAFRPGDVLDTRKGLRVEIDNTDAEGRLVLCDALWEGASEKPQLMIDFATLTGAARVALGTEVAAFFTESDDIAHALMDCAAAVSDPLWRLPLHKAYLHELKSRIADLSNCSSSGYGGAITAALFLQKFVPATVDWVHFDVMAWNTRARPGHPLGGEAMALLAVFRYLQGRFTPLD